MNDPAPGKRVPVRAHWRGPDGVSHTGWAQAPPDSEAGSHVPLWVDAAGQPTTRPQTRADTVIDAVDAGLGAAAASSIVHAGVFALIRRRLDQLRYAQWDREWSAITKRRSQRG